MKTEWRINFAISILVILLAEFGRRTLYLCSTFINIFLSYAGIFISYNKYLLSACSK
jgi:hypothetical protein